MVTCTSEKMPWLEEDGTDVEAAAAVRLWWQRCTKWGMTAAALLDWVKSFEKMWGQLRNVLALIVEGKGGNDLVEIKRGKKFRNLDLPKGDQATVVVVGSSKK